MKTFTNRTLPGTSAAIGILGIIASAGCARTSAPPPEMSEQEARTAVDAVRAQFMDALATSDFATLGVITHPDAVMIGAGGEGHLKMYQAAGAGLAPEYRIDITPQEFVMMDPEWAFERGTSVQSWQPEGEAERAEIRNSYLLILRYDDGQWKPYREVASAMPPPGGWPEDAE